MTALEKRLQLLKQLLATELDSYEPSLIYIADLKESISDLEKKIPNQNKNGYTMVK